MQLVHIRRLATSAGRGVMNALEIPEIDNRPSLGFTESGK
jgi:hypothetical protein